jgi:4-amino-4-deoxy-L-arabinose transferase-like glycosyltransferase
MQHCAAQQPDQADERAPGQPGAPRPGRQPSPRWPAFLAGLAFASILIAGTMLRLWHLAASPAWQWDEAVYYRVAVNVQHGVLGEHALRGVAWQPFLYQPPFYLLMLARWFSVTGASIYHARVLGVILTAAMLAVLFRLLWKIHGPGAAIFAILPVVFDGWLMYIERVSYIENALILVIAVAFLLYQRAVEQPSWPRFAVAGAVLGFAAVFKQTGAYALLAVLLCWLITRRAHRGHLVLLGAFLTVVLAYLATMIRLYDVPGHDWYVNQSLVQVRRVLGLQQSGGTLTSPGSVLHLLAAQYRFFIPSVLIALTALVTVVRRVLRCYAERSWVPARGNALLFSWLVAGIVVFGISSLKFPQYFALILIPAYCFLWTELCRWNWPQAWKGAAAGAAALAGVGSLLLAMPALSANTLSRVQQYAAAHIPAGRIVVTEQSIGDLIQQPWCTVEYANPCLHAASYAITWQTYLQSSFQQGDTAFRQLMQGAVPVKSFSGAVGTATVWKLRSTS